MPKFYAFEVHCEELVDPPVLAVVTIDAGDRAMLLAYRDLFDALKVDHRQLASMSFLGVTGMVAWFPEDAVEPKILELLRANEGKGWLSDELVRTLHVQEERLVEDLHLHLDENGSWYTATVRHSEVVVSVGVLTWEDLQKEPLT